MNIFTEKKAEEFLEKEGFQIVKTEFISTKEQLKEIIEKINFPIVMKSAGQEIIHKKRIGGVKTNVSNLEEAKKTFDELKQVQGTEEIVVQKQIKGEEFILGIKKTPEFEHVVLFGIGGSDVEKIKKVSFRVPPLEEKDILEIIQEIGIENEEKKELIKRNILQLCELSERYPNIKELDINPLMVTEQYAQVVDARIVFEDEKNLRDTKL